MKLSSQLPDPRGRALSPNLRTSAQPSNLADFFRQSVARNPDGPYLGRKVGKDYHYQSYRQVEAQVEHLASALIARQLQPGDRLATFADNRPEWRVSDFAAAYAGLIHAPLYNQMSERNAAYILRDSGSKAVVVDTPERLQVVLKADLPDLKTIIAIDPKALEGQSDPRLIGWDAFLQLGQQQLASTKPQIEQRIGQTQAQNLGGMVYTSGSTGDPKGVQLSHGNWLSEIEGVLKVVNDQPEANLTNVRRDDRYASVLPQGHVMGRVSDYVITAEGGSIAYPESLMAFKKDLKVIQPTVLAVTPLFFQKIYEEAEKKSRKDSSPVIEPKLAALGAGAAAAAIGGLAGGLAGTAIGGGMATWGLALVGATLVGALADRAAQGAAQNLTKPVVFDWAVQQARDYHGSQGNPSIPSRVGQLVAEKAVFSQLRHSVDEATGGQVRLMMSGGAALGSDVEAVFRSAGYNIAQGYGLSETAGASLMNSPYRSQLGTVGQPLPGVEVRLDPQSREIQLKGPNVMAGGYLNKPDKTAESFTSDGWYRTGDSGKVVSVPTRDPLLMAVGAGLGSSALGAAVGASLGQPWLGAALLGGIGALAGYQVAQEERQDFYSITGRIKSQFKLPGGEYVTPEPIEEDLKVSPYISEAVVVGARDRDLVGALIVPKFDNLQSWAQSQGLDGSDPKKLVSYPQVVDLLRREALQHSANHAKHEQVRAVALLDQAFSLDKDELTPSFKVKRPVVVEHYAPQIEAMFR